eukprot:SAG31_NODE_33720_length_337_cov_1.493776_1_plen_28_part_01
MRPQDVGGIEWPAFVIAVKTIATAVARV